MNISDDGRWRDVRVFRRARRGKLFGQSSLFERLFAGVRIDRWRAFSRERREETGRDAGRGERRPAANGARASGRRARLGARRRCSIASLSRAVSYLAVQHRVRVVEQVRHPLPASNDRRRARLDASALKRRPAARARRTDQLEALGA